MAIARGEVQRVPLVPEASAVLEVGNFRQPQKSMRRQLWHWMTFVPPTCWPLLAYMLLHEQRQGFFFALTIIFLRPPLRDFGIVEIIEYL